MNCMDAAETNATTTSAESELEYAWCRRDETCMFVCNVSCHDATWYESGDLSKAQRMKPKSIATRMREVGRQCKEKPSGESRGYVRNYI